MHFTCTRRPACKPLCGFILGTETDFKPAQQQKGKQSSPGTWRLEREFPFGSDPNVHVSDVLLVDHPSTINNWGRGEEGGRGGLCVLMNHSVIVAPRALFSVVPYLERSCSLQFRAVTVSLLNPDPPPPLPPPVHAIPFALNALLKLTLTLQTRRPTARSETACRPSRWTWPPPSPPTPST